MLKKIRILLIVVFTIIMSVIFYRTIFSPPTLEEKLGLVSENSSKTSGINPKKFYYEQLSEKEKEIYKNFTLSEKDFINNKSIFCCSKNQENKIEYQTQDIADALKAYRYDNPLSRIWVKNQIGISSRKNSFYISPLENNRYGDLPTDETIKALKELDTKSKKFVSSLSGSNVEKALAIYNWLIDLADYDETTSLPNTEDPYGTIVLGRSTCCGFAYAFKYLCDLAGIDALYIVGYVSNSPTTLHAWNLVYVGEWRIVDVTLGNSSRSNFEKMQYFLISDKDDFYKDYKPEVIYPSN